MLGIKLKALLSMYITTVGIDNPLVLKTDTQEIENLDKAIFS
jgi:hypothetical protein